MNGLLWTDDAPEIRIEGGIVQLSFRSGSERIEFRATPSVLLEIVRKGSTAYAQFIKGRVAPVEIKDEKRRRKRKSKVRTAVEAREDSA